MLTREQCREIDRKAIEELGIPGIVLMENAGRGCTEVLLNELRKSGYPIPETHCASDKTGNHEIRWLPDPMLNDSKAGVVICCGPGNNGGDGFVMARHLAIRNVPTKVILFAARERYQGDALTNLRVIERMNLPIVNFDPDWNMSLLVSNLESVQHQKVCWLVDALLGTGSFGVLSDPIRQAIDAINQSDTKRLAVDIPTGMDCNTGNLEGEAVRADITCTFVERKTGFSNQQAIPYLGEVMVIGIGAPK